MKKILITGASGFIGSFLVEHALEKNYEVYAGIRKTSNTEYLSDKRIKVIELDFSDSVNLNRTLANLPYFDFIVHNAGLTKAFKKKEYSVTNYQYTKNFVDALIKENKVPEKFIYMSSLAAFGPGNPVTLSPVKSTDTPNPVTAYGKSKLEAERFLSSLSAFPYIIFRPTAVYGPREKDFFLMIKLINNNLELLIGNKIQHLTFIYVKDLAKAVYKAIESDLINRAYFISDGNTYESQTIGTLIKEELNKKTVRIRFPLALVKFIASLTEATKYFSGRQSILNPDKINELECVNWKCDVQPLIDDFNFSPDYNLKKGINETIDWYKREKWLK